MSPPTRNGAPPQGPVQITATRQGARDHPQDDTAAAAAGSGRVVHVVERLLSATVHVPTPAATRLLLRTATAAGCEQEPGGRWIVYGSRLPSVIAAMEAAGYTVERTANGEKNSSIPAAAAEAAETP